MKALQQKASVLILCPHPEETGGVSHYYTLFRKHFRSDSIDLEFLYTGKSSVGCWFTRTLHPLGDLFSLMKALSCHDLVVLNPSLDPKSILRDGLFNLVARCSRKKTVVFFRGWSPRWEEMIDRHARGIFRLLFSADRVIILCSRFRDTLSSWGFPPARIVQETTAYEHHESTLPKDPLRILFLSRFARGKGCLEAIKAVELLVAECPEILLYMAGDGELMPELCAYVRERGLGRHVEFTGWLSGERKYRLLGECGIMLYPTDYGEGMPNALVEGMGMGLAVVSRPVAGIADIVVDGENGFLVPSMEPADFAARVAELIGDRELWQAISQRNRKVGRERFAITSVVARLESLYVDLLQPSGG